MWGNEHERLQFRGSVHDRPSAPADRRGCSWHAACSVRTRRDHARGAPTTAPHARRPRRRFHAEGGPGQMKRGTQGQGRLFRRTSRHRRKPLPTWWLAYYVNGTERRESAHASDRDKALGLLRDRLKRVSDGMPVDPARERVTVGTILDGLLAHYARKGLRSHNSVASQVKSWRESLREHARALDVTSRRLDEITGAWQAAGVNPATINRRLALLRRAYRLAKLHLDPARLDFAE